ncbi:MAG: glucose-1-phosphate adenylyltransferase [Syntrophobacterales bacterium]|jgi:glucose-1-phosphate adenylyltransferase|nr:glucose-1-phosphate adenylyltransferase [Syntrophobacterales bacterium]
MKDVLALILAGGRVDELDVLTFFRPKSIMPFGGLYRIIDFPMSNLSHSGIERVGIFSQYRPLHLMEHISNGAPWDMAARDRFITILPPFKGREISDWYKGTADAVYQNLDFVSRANPELILILSGDHIYKMDYRSLINFHLRNKADLTIAFAKVPKEGAHRFGLAHIEEETKQGGKILQYEEKPKKPDSEWASLTIYVFKPQVLLDALTANAQNNSHEFGKDIIPELLKTCNVYGYTHRGYWGYTRTPLEYWQANMDLLGRNPKLDIRSWEILTNISHRILRDRPPALIGESADVENSLFYGGCTIKGKVKNSILFPGVTVDEGAVVEDSIIFFNTMVKKGATVARTIIDIQVEVGKGARVGKDGYGDLTLIGMGVKVPEGITIPEGVRIHPNINAEHFAKSEYKPGDVIQ